MFFVMPPCYHATTQAGRPSSRSPGPARREILAWLDKAVAEKEQAEAALEAAARLAPPELSVDDVLVAVERCGGLAGVLGQVTDAERATLYAAMGISAVYNPARNEVRLGVDPVASTACRRWDSSISATRSR